MFRSRTLRAHEAGMSTAEYAVGTLGAATIAALLINPGNPVVRWLERVLTRTLESLLDADMPSLLTLPQLFARAVESLWPW